MKVTSGLLYIDQRLYKATMYIHVHLHCQNVAQTKIYRKFRVFV